MGDIYNKGRLYLTLHTYSNVKEYYGTDCIGKMVEVTTNISNNKSEKLLAYNEIPKEAFCKIFNTSECYESN